MLNLPASHSSREHLQFTWAVNPAIVIPMVIATLKRFCFFIFRLRIWHWWIFYNNWSRHLRACDDIELACRKNPVEINCIATTHSNTNECAYLYIFYMIPYHMAFYICWPSAYLWQPFERQGRLQASGISFINLQARFFSIPKETWEFFNIPKETWDNIWWANTIWRDLCLS